MSTPAFCSTTITRNSSTSITVISRTSRTPCHSNSQSATLKRCSFLATTISRRSHNETTSTPNNLSTATSFNTSKRRALLPQILEPEQPDSLLIWYHLWGHSPPKIDYLRSHDAFQALSLHDRLLYEYHGQQMVVDRKGHELPVTYHQGLPTIGEALWESLHHVQTIPIAEDSRFREKNSSQHPQITRNAAILSGE